LTVACIHQSTLFKDSSHKTCRGLPCIHQSNGLSARPRIVIGRTVEKPYPITGRSKHPPDRLSDCRRSQSFRPRRRSLNEQRSKSHIRRTGRSKHPPDRLTDWQRSQSVRPRSPLYRRKGHSPPESELPGGTSSGDGWRLNGTVRPERYDIRYDNRAVRGRIAGG
jgi:hypothetical protein